jgi:hypothetical protein
MATAAATTACGGDDATLPITRIELRETSPNLHVGQMQTVADSSASLELRAPDGFSAVSYCLLRVSGMRHANGSSYQMGIAYGVADSRVLVVTLSNRESSWLVAAFNPPGAQAVVHRSQRRLTLEALRSTQGMQVGWEATLGGEVVIPVAASGSGACD